VERMTATSADGGGALVLAPERISERQAPERAPVVDRTGALRRQLAAADVMAGLLGGLSTAAVASMGTQSALVLALAIGAAWPVFAYLCGLSASEDLRAWASSAGQAPRLVLASLALSWPAFGALAALGAGRPVWGALSVTAFTAAAAGLSRAAVRARLHRTLALRQRTVIVGSGLVASRLVDRLRRHPQLGLLPTGYLDDDPHAGVETGVPRLGGLDALAPLLERGGADRVMIAFSRASHQELLHCIRVCRDAGVTVDVVPRLFEFLDGARTVDQVGGMPLLTISVPSFSRLARFTKRVLDVVVASVAVLALAPLILVIAIAIKLDSRGPVLFVQPRAGRRGRFFDMLKFRSMRVGSDVLVREDGAIVKHENDSRITRVGRLLRRLSLDELPQLFNVLRGDMSLVGPRPLVVAEAEALNEPWHGRRADLRPGLTGPWQISGRSHIPFQEMIMLDYQYVAGWSLARDVEILLATVPAVLSGRGAY
jgi:exopolysaccharide biosynthesis polyprenyl glycosylphosphotransferase